MATRALVLIASSDVLIAAAWVSRRKVILLAQKDRVSITFYVLYTIVVYQ